MNKWATANKWMNEGTHRFYLTAVQSKYVEGGHVCVECWDPNTQRGSFNIDPLIPGNIITKTYQWYSIIYVYLFIHNPVKSKYSTWNWYRDATIENLYRVLEAQWSSHHIHHVYGAQWSDPLTWMKPVYFLSMSTSCWSALFLMAESGSAPMAIR